jgi:hypothetical protein
VETVREGGDARARTRARRGRYRTKQPEARGRFVKLTLNEGEHDLLRAGAAVTGLTPAGFATEAALAAARKAAPPAGSPLRDLLVELMQDRRQVQRIGTNLNQAVAKLNAIGADSGNLPQYAEACLRVARRLEETAAHVRRRLG